MTLCYNFSRAHWPLNYNTDTAWEATQGFELGFGSKASVAAQHYLVNCCLTFMVLLTAEKKLWLKRRDKFFGFRLVRLSISI